MMEALHPEKAQSDRHIPDFTQKRDIPMKKLEPYDTTFSIKSLKTQFKNLRDTSDRTDITAVGVANLHGTNEILALFQNADHIATLQPF